MFRTFTRTIAIATALTLAAAVASAASVGPIVPPGGNVAGKSYAYYLERAWQVTLAGPAQPKTCNTITVGSQRVALILGGYSGKPEKHTCTVSAGEPIYIDGIGDECSSLHGDHGNFGTTDSDLKRCARSQYARGHAAGGASLDGQPVANLAKTIVATGTYAIHLSKHNILGIKSTSGRSAAYGEGLLLQSVAAGTHVIDITGNLGTFKADVTDTVNVD
jgi:uncharacterized membrane protein